jgi:hypothetical protein
MGLTRKWINLYFWGGLIFGMGILCLHKKVKGPSLSDWRSPAGRDTLNQFCFFIAYRSPNGTT